MQIRRMNVMAVVITALLLIGGTLGQAEAPVPCPHATAVMESVWQVYDKITSFYAKALSINTVEEEAMPISVFQFEIWFDYPRMRMDMVVEKDDLQFTSTMISGLQTEFIYLYMDGQWSKMKLDPVLPDTPRGMFLGEDILYYTALDEGMLAERAVWVIEGAGMIAGQPQRVTWWIDQQTYFIVQMALISEMPPQGNITTTIQWKEFMPHIAIPGEKFAVPEDVPLVEPGVPFERPTAPFPAPEFRAVDTAGEEIALVDLRGKVVLINFWASWCPPCIDKLPLIQQLYQQYAVDGLVVIGINLDRTEQAMEQMLEIFGITFRQIFEQADEISDLFNVIGIPATFLIDRQGIVRYLHLHREDRLRAAIERLLAEQ